ncbi:hypothetical protein KIH74_34630 [Kineosporia sp. J2-2]|uniref:Uncharacterized protein n=1 Tax=Kineosporia corallincola TaxID=2835133 RepID=A0ABS5TTK8_9ACTN|nr:hypothetical protein [Kineosporia corallincola]MBT0774133.1 hypothetical protein [Kineosporia corallincola]
MRMLLRERIVSHILDHPQRDLTDPAGDLAFVPATLGWLDQVADTLHQLRQPLSGLVRSQITLVSSSAAATSAVSRSAARKAQTDRAVRAVTEVQAHLVALAQKLDEELQDWTQRLAQLLTVVVANGVCPLPEDPSEENCRRLWRDLARVEEVQTVHAYLSTVVPRVDLLQILHDLLKNLLGWGTWGRSQPGSAGTIAASPAASR